MNYAEPSWWPIDSSSWSSIHWVLYFAGIALACAVLAFLVFRRL